MLRKIIIVSLILLSTPLALFAHAENPHDELIIRMTNNGFEPRELTVTEGDEVLFINNDDTEHWPASNFHPTHTLYPEFDPQRGIPPGESWRFKFEKPGTWRMHDHLIPHFTGTIIVKEDSDKPAPADLAVKPPSDSQGLTFWAKIKSFFSKFFKTSAVKSSNSVDQKLLAEFKGLDEQAKYAWLEKRALLESPKVAWAYILSAYNTPEGVVGSPHDMAHLVGQLIYKEYDFDGLSICTPVFAFGCYHGLMEVAFDKDNAKNYQQSLMAAQKGCEKLLDGETPAAETGYWSCLHGMGHGIATFREHDIEKSMKDCITLNESIRTYCKDGVFMEFSISAPENFYRENDPVYPCNILDESHHTACARAQVQVMRLRFGMGTSEIANNCIQTGKYNIIYHCVDALGYFIGQSSSGNASKVIQGCNEIEHKEKAAQCMAAAAGELIFQNTVGWHSAVEKICHSISSQYRRLCDDRIANVKKSYGRK